MAGAVWRAAPAPTYGSGLEQPDHQCHAQSGLARWRSIRRWSNLTAFETSPGEAPLFRRGAGPVRVGSLHTFNAGVLPPLLFAPHRARAAGSPPTPSSSMSGADHDAGPPSDRQDRVGWSWGPRRHHDTGIAALRRADAAASSPWRALTIISWPRAAGDGARKQPLASSVA